MSLVLLWGSKDDNNDIFQTTTRIWSCSKIDLKRFFYLALKSVLVVIPLEGIKKSKKKIDMNIQSLSL